jgi:hypothetical protein
VRKIKHTRCFADAKLDPEAVRARCREDNAQMIITTRAIVIERLSLIELFPVQP